MEDIKEDSFFKKVYKNLLTGLLLCLPITLTIYFLIWLINIIANPAKGILMSGLETFLDEKTLAFFQESMAFNIATTLVSAFIVLCILVLVGFFSTKFLGQSLLALFEKILHKLPGVRSVYNSIKEIIDTFSKGKTYKHAVLIEFPLRGYYSIGFITGEKDNETWDVAGKPLTNVFIPTSPNPTGGYMILIPTDEIKILEMSVAEALKMVVSGGATIPLKKEVGAKKEI